MEAPEKWVFPFADKEIDTLKLDEVLSADALLLGAVTYQIFADSWPSRCDPEGFADKMDGVGELKIFNTGNYRWVLFLRWRRC